MRNCRQEMLADQLPSAENVCTLCMTTLHALRRGSSSNSGSSTTSSTAAVALAMGGSKVWLGLAGDITGPEVSPDHYSTRVGGAPIFPGHALPQQWTGGNCQVCGASLSLVLQAYAPLPQQPDRVLLLLGCTRPGCGRSPGCWQAVRCQLPPMQPQQQAHHHQQQQQHPPNHQGDVGSNVPSLAVQQEPAAAGRSPNLQGTGFDGAAGDDWGFAAAGPDSGFGGGWDAPQPAGAGTDTFDFSDLTSSLTAAVQQQQQHQEQERKRKQEQQQKRQRQQQQVDTSAAAQADLEGQVAAPAAGSTKGAAGPELPGFYLYSETEPDAASSKAISTKELQHVQELLSAYEAADTTPAPTGSSTSSSTGNTSSSSAQPTPTAAAAGAPTAEAEGEVGASWAGEEYEPDNVRCIQRSYLKFMKRLARQPQQCARYCHNGPVLWPQSKLPQPSPCQSCGGPRVFELQLMPALSQLVLEAAGMIQEMELGVDATVVNVVANWDWCTVAVFTCQSSCSSTSASDPEACQIHMEEVVAVTEAECENQAGL